ncbi:hypothetical protein [Catenuloplanes atrovinosus]|uniref:Uncharacterized protein n=1 Tax=Catenuloplanes atrovinosus TaxID=137266 RepID=A0AAE3YUT1_9ACTN|nr:hypothetical protein [Catenuloplanes atrovinosus]MDR7278763.1 hypothetical protein [Catenuloplanes atrovinosus]
MPPTVSVLTCRVVPGRAFCESRWVLACRVVPGRAFYESRWVVGD